MIKKLACFCLTLVCGTMLLFNSSAIDAKAYTVVNVAENATVYASSTEGPAYLPQYAVDGDMTTRWSSQFVDNQSITLDLGQVYSITNIVINWEAAYASKYSVSWSSDGITWHNDAIIQQGFHGGESSNMMFNWPVRFVRVECKERATEYGISIYEIQLLTLVD